MTADGGPAWGERRLSFGAGADDYDRYRPGYPDDAVRWCAGRARSRVIDVGSGTGRFAAATLRLGYDVLAVEPDPGMRAVAESVLPGRTAAGSAEAIPVPDASADSVTAAQAYHWFDPEPAHAEFARVLRPGGHVALVWNSRDDRVPWVRDLSAIVGGEDRFTAIEAQGAPPLSRDFAPTEAASWTHGQPLSVDELVGLVGSYSYVRLRTDRDDVLAEVRALVTDHPDLQGTDLAMPYVTRAYRAQVLRS
jgi:SAM-dependent methyltransferase